MWLSPREDISICSDDWCGVSAWEPKAEKCDRLLKDLFKNPVTTILSPPKHHLSVSTLALFIHLQTILPSRNSLTQKGSLVDKVLPREHWAEKTVLEHLVQFPRGRRKNWALWKSTTAGTTFLSQDKFIFKCCSSWLCSLFKNKSDRGKWRDDELANVIAVYWLP